jgi:pimeloyl-ACP methyl ester carboxylesterase
MANLVYLPARAPVGWVVWLHGGPHEHVSPRFNPYFDLLLRSGFGVVALNYPGSTGNGNGYELRDTPPQRWLDVQVKAIQRDLAQLRAELPGLESHVLVAVSYGSVVAHALLARGATDVSALVDFSGMGVLVHEAARQRWPRALFLYGTEDPVLQRPQRRALIQAFERNAPTQRVEIPGEGHFILRRSSVASISSALKAFVEAGSALPAAAGGPPR